MRGWIRCSDRLPEEGFPVLAYACNENRSDIITALFIEKGAEIVWYLIDYCVASERLEHNWSITHWMPLPDPPGKGE